MAIPLDIGLIRLVLSLVLGGLIGLEREIRHSPAGLRTVALVCAGSTLFTLVSLSFTGMQADVSRVVAQIVIGIGFIGGGVIWKMKETVHGLTTAASLWVASAIGILVGLGEYMFATLTTIIIMTVLWLGKWEKKVLH